MENQNKDEVKIDFRDQLALLKFGSALPAEVLGITGNPSDQSILREGVVLLRIGT